MKKLILAFCASSLFAASPSTTKCLDMATHIVCLELIYDGSLNTVVIPIVYKSALLAMGSPMQASTVQPVADGELAIHVGDSIRFPGYKAATLIFDDGTQQILTAAELAACKVKP